MQLGSAAQLAGDTARDLDPRYKTQRRCAREDGCRFRIAGTLAALPATLASRQSPLETHYQRNRSARRKRRISALPNVLLHLPGATFRRTGIHCTGERQRASSALDVQTSPSTE